MLNFLLQVSPNEEIVDSASTFKMNVTEAITALSGQSGSDVLNSLSDKIIAFGLKVLVAILIYFIGKWIINRLKKVVSVIFKKKKTDPAIATFTTSLISIILTVLLIVVIIGTLGINTTSFAALLAAGGMAIGLALSGTMQNFAGGVMILLFKPFKTGDFIDAMGHKGTVSEVTIVSTKLTTPDNRVIIIPNGALSSNSIDNYSMNELRKLEWLVDVEYGVDSQAVKDTIIKILASDSRILDIKSGAANDPMVEINSLKDSSVQFVVRAWVTSGNYWDVNFNINNKIYTELPKNGINFPFPQLDVNLKGTSKN